nr:C40 family peptidase [Ruminococcus sp.]
MSIEKKYRKKMIAVSAAAVIAVSGMCFPAASSAAIFDTAVTASAAEVASPRLSAGTTCGDKLIVYVDNYQGYSDSTEFTVKISGRTVKNMTGAELKSAKGKLTFTNNGNTYLKPYTRYTVKVTAAAGSTALSSEIKVCTSYNSYYTIQSGAAYYVRSGGVLKAAGTMGSGTYRGQLCDVSGNAVAGKSVDSSAVGYVKVAVPAKAGKNANQEQLYTYRYVYVKPAQASRKPIESVRNVAANFAIAASRVPNQTYYLCGEQFTNSSLVSDCSGLTKAAYLRTGLYLEHNAEAQANTSGKLTVFDNIVQTGYSDGVRTYRFKNSSARVDVDSLEKGDLLFFICSTNNQQVNPDYVNDGIGHVGLYIGNGQFVHFTSSYGKT